MKQQQPENNPQKIQTELNEEEKLWNCVKKEMCMTFVFN